MHKFMILVVALISLASASSFGENKSAPLKDKAKAVRKPDSAGQWHRENVRNIAKANKMRDISISDCPMSEEERSMNETFGTAYYIKNGVVFRLVKYYSSTNQGEADRAVLMNMSTCEKSEISY